MGDKLQHFMKNIQILLNFAPKYGTTINIKLNYARKAVEKSGRGLKSNLHKLQMTIITVWVPIFDRVFSNLFLFQIPVS